VTVNDVLRVLRERRLLVVGCLLLGLLGATAATRLLPRDYSSQVTMYVSATATPAVTPAAPATPAPPAPAAQPGESAYQANQLAKDRMPSYVQLLSSDRITGAVVRTLALPTTPAELATRMTVTALPDTQVITAAVTDRSPEQAAAIANAVASEFTALVGQLQQPGTGQISVQIVQPAVPPTTSLALPAALTIGLGGVVGLLLGLVAAFFRNAVDTSVRSPGHLRDLTGAPTLGTVPAVRALRKAPLVTAYDARAPLTEAFRKIRTALYFRGERDRDGTGGTVVVITSAAAREGSTTTACNIAIAAAGAGWTALVIDANLRTPKVSTLFGLDASPGLTDVLAGRSALGEALQSYRHEDVIVDVLAAGRVRKEDTGRVTSLLDLTEIVDEARRNYDLVLLDTPPMGPVADAAAVAPLTDGAVVVVRHGRTHSAAQVDGVVETLRAVGAPLIGSVLTMVPAAKRAARPRKPEPPVKASTWASSRRRNGTSAEVPAPRRTDSVLRDPVLTTNGQPRPEPAVDPDP
jgi:succinoglycan biosynthesis transport protein ExoP